MEGMFAYISLNIFSYFFFHFFIFFLCVSKVIELCVLDVKFILFHNLFFKNFLNCVKKHKICRLNHFSV